MAKFQKPFLLVLLFSICLMLAGGKRQVSLSSYEEEIAKKIGFDKQVLVMVKEETGEHLHRMTGYNEEGYQIMLDGICVSVPEDRTEHLLSILRRKLRPKKYMVFVVEINDGIKTDKVGILKGTDQYDLLRVMQTSGSNYDVTNEDVIEKLKEWGERYPFDIVGAENDWVEIEFKKLPKDIKSFAEEVYEFCPDAVDQGSGTVEGLVKELKTTKRLFLWWD